jgi:hypothetical protein
MDTLLIELTNPKALSLLQDMENLDLIRVLKQDTNTTKPKLSSILRKSISKKEAEDFNRAIQQARGEWE